MEDEYTEMPPTSDYYIIYHLLVKAKAFLDEALNLLGYEGDEGFEMTSDPEIDLRLSEHIFEVNSCLESIKLNPKLESQVDS